MTLREQKIIVLSVVIPFSLALLAFLDFKVHELKETTGKSIVQDQVATGLAKRKAEDLRQVRRSLSLDANAIQVLDSALAKRLQLQRNPSGDAIATKSHRKKVGG